MLDSCESTGCKEAVSLILPSLNTSFPHFQGCLELLFMVQPQKSPVSHQRLFPDWQTQVLLWAIQGSRWLCWSNENLPLALRYLACTTRLLEGRAALGGSTTRPKQPPQPPHEHGCREAVSDTSTSHRQQCGNDGKSPTFIPDVTLVLLGLFGLKEAVIAL